MKLHFNREIKNLELRSCDRYITSNREHNTAEIVRWIPRDEGKPFCIVIAAWHLDDEGFYLVFIGDRPFDKEVNAEDFWALAQDGQSRLNDYFGE